MDVNSCDPYDWVTGITVGLRGSADSQGKFKVSSVVEAGIPVLPPRNIPEEDYYVALVSGLHYGSEDGSISSARSLLVEFLNGDIFVMFPFKEYNSMLMISCVA